ncbi:MAG: hypothetical protein WD278_07180 [Pirellulales bacterium]
MKTRTIPMKSIACDSVALAVCLTPILAEADDTTQPRPVPWTRDELY